MSPLPLVSCIMPTRNRRLFVDQAIWYFLRQDYLQRELIIIDDGEEAVSDLVPQDRRIRYVRLEKRMPLGAKRNLACEMSQGELIAHWDDDDWMAPQRLSIQVSQLLDSGADACGIRDVLYYRIMAGDAWLYHYPDHQRPWVAGGTLIYRRSAWVERRFPETNVGEDSAFVFQLPPDRIHVIEDTSFYIALIHPRNTGSKNMSDRRWERRSLDDVNRLLAFDRDFYVALRNGRSQNSATSSQSALSLLTVAAQYNVSTGYGSMAEYLVLGMARAGATVNAVPLDLQLEGLTQEFKEILQRSKPGFKRDTPVLYFSWPRSDLQRFRAASDLFINTMWESDQLPAGWAEQLNYARAVIVPTRFVAQVFRNSGVTVPIEVIKQGIDPDIYHYEERPAHSQLTTLIVGPVDNRKNTLTAIAAWEQAFAGDNEARLIIKTNYGYHNYTPGDPRIQYIDVNETTRGIAHWYRQADILLALGNEGFGLPLVEGMATGLPVIALSSEGQADVAEDARGLLLTVQPTTWEVDNRSPFGPSGLRGVPGIEDVASHLRWIATHRDEAREMGLAASYWAQQQRNIWTMGLAALEVMERYVQPPKPLRRVPTVWVPSWRTPCGIAEYTAHLTQAMQSVRITRDQPDMQGARILHIQHEMSLFNDNVLTNSIQQARHAGVPVILTEHTVDSEVRAWERDTNVLVTLSQRGTDMLRSRWPDKKVEYIPLGCPTWFPPRKSTRGRVIGVFGFLQKHKGFWRLPDVLRALPGTELLMFSYATSPATERDWMEATAGLPVRRVGEFLPIDEIARCLAAEADILVFWYDQIMHASASYAARIGLATGVPMLVSPTNWFLDMRDVTYQPDNLVEGVQRLLDDTSLREQLTARAQAYCHEHSWSRIAERHLALWRTLEGTK
jgi:glycosyltransferase involved in cell wall biosynthesis